MKYNIWHDAAEDSWLLSFYLNNLPPTKAQREHGSQASLIYFLVLSDDAVFGCTVPVVTESYTFKRLFIFLA